MILGFTGTRQGLTPKQLVALTDLIAACESDLLLHGGAPGADTEVDSICAFLLTHKTEIYPCTPERYLHWIEKGDGVIRAVHAPRPPLTRNQIIVRRCDRLIACPAEMEEQARGGTWYTYRKARQANKPRTIVYPNGTVEHDNGSL